MSTLRTFLFIGLCAVSALGQSLTSLNGTVTDQSGGAVGGAIVEIVNLNTASKRSVLCDDTGLYTFSQVAPGRYKVTAKAAGFSVTNIENVELMINTPSTIAIRLELGAVTETVAVISEGVQVNTVDASLGQRRKHPGDCRAAI